MAKAYSNELARLEALLDLTLRALVAELCERGILTRYGAVWRTGSRCPAQLQKKDAVRNPATPA